MGNAALNSSQSLIFPLSFWQSSSKTAVKLCITPAKVAPTRSYIKGYSLIWSSCRSIPDSRSSALHTGMAAAMAGRHTDRSFSHETTIVLSSRVLGIAGRNCPLAHTIMSSICTGSGLTFLVTWILSPSRRPLVWASSWDLAREKSNCFSAALSLTKKGPASTNALAFLHASSHEGCTTFCPPPSPHRNFTVRRTLSVTRCVESCTHCTKTPPRVFTIFSLCLASKPVKMTLGLLSESDVCESSTAEAPDVAGVFRFLDEPTGESIDFSSSSLLLFLLPFLPLSSEFDVSSTGSSPNSWISGDDSSIVGLALFPLVLLLDLPAVTSSILSALWPDPLDTSGRAAASLSAFLPLPLGLRVGSTSGWSSSIPSLPSPGSLGNSGRDMAGLSALSVFLPLPLALRVGSTTGWSSSALSLLWPGSLDASVGATAGLSTLPAFLPLPLVPRAEPGWAATAWSCDCLRESSTHAFRLPLPFFCCVLSLGPSSASFPSETPSPTGIVVFPCDTTSLAPGPGVSQSGWWFATFPLLFLVRVSLVFADSVSSAFFPLLLLADRAVDGGSIGTSFSGSSANPGV